MSRGLYAVELVADCSKLHSPFASPGLSFSWQNDCSYGTISRARHFTLRAVARSLGHGARLARPSRAHRKSAGQCEEQRQRDHRPLGERGNASAAAAAAADGTVCDRVAAQRHFSSSRKRFSGQACAGSHGDARVRKNISYQRTVRVERRRAHDAPPDVAGWTGKLWRGRRQK